MSGATNQADKFIKEAQEETAKIALADIRVALEKLAFALSSICTAVEELEGSLDRIDCEDPGIQISSLKDSVGDLERRIENLERKAD